MIDEDDYQLRLYFIRNYLKQAADGGDIGRNVSDALFGADRFGKHVLRPEDAEELKFLAVSAAMHACELFPAWVPRKHIRLGFRAFYLWLDRAQRPCEQRVADRRSFTEHSRWMRLLRNHGHNVSLVDQIDLDSGDHQRRKTVIADLKRSAGA